MTGWVTVGFANTDYATVAYGASTGAQLWVKRYNGSGNSDDKAQSIVASPDGSKVFVTGWTRLASGDYDYGTVAYDPSTGAKLWVKLYNGPANASDFAHSVAASPDGSTVFVTGESQGVTTGDDYATVAGRVRQRGV